jgi:hexosaminidase
VADAVEPFGIDIRQAARHYSSSTPLNRLVDAARPESESIAELEQLARTGQKPGQNNDQLRSTFTLWTLSPEFISQDNYLLAEVASVARDLAEVGAIGLQILDQMKSGNAATENWIIEKKQLLDKLEQPRAEVRLAAVRPVRDLLDGMSRSPGLAVSH